MRGHTDTPGEVPAILDDYPGDPTAARQRQAVEDLLEDIRSRGKGAHG